MTTITPKQNIPLRLISHRTLFDKMENAKSTETPPGTGILLKQSPKLFYRVRLSTWSNVVTINASTTFAVLTSCDYAAARVSRGYP